MLVWDEIIHLKRKVAVTSIRTSEVLVYSSKTSCYTLYRSYKCKYETNGFDKVPLKVVYQTDSIEDMFDAWTKHACCIRRKIICVFKASFEKKLKCKKGG